MAARPTCDETVIELLLIDVFGSCREITRFEFDVSSTDTFFLGNLANNPDSLGFVIFGTFILNVELVDIPAAKIVSWFTPVTPTPNGDRVRVVPRCYLLDCIQDQRKFHDYMRL